MNCNVYRQMDHFHFDIVTVWTKADDIIVLLIFKLVVLLIDRCFEEFSWFLSSPFLIRQRGKSVIEKAGVRNLFNQYRAQINYPHVNPSYLRTLLTYFRN